MNRQTQRPGIGAKTGARANAAQRVAQAAAGKELETIEQEIGGSHDQWGSSWGPAGKRRRNGGSPGDHSWQPSKSPAVEAILSRPPVARWNVDQELNVHYIDTSLVRDPDGKEHQVSDHKDHVRRAVLQVYVNVQRDFIRTGNTRDLKEFNPQEKDYGSLFEPECRVLLDKFRPTGLLQGQYFYLPNGCLCAARLLHLAVREPSIRAALNKVLEEEKALVAAGNEAFSADLAARKMATILKSKFDAHQFHYWCRICKPDVPTDSRKRRQYWATILRAEPPPAKKESESP